MKKQKETLRRLLVLFLNFILLYGGLRIIITLGERVHPLFYYIGSSAYMITLGVLVIVYFYLNGGTFDNRAITAEDLPSDWSLTEKRDWLAKVSVKRGKAKKLLYVLMPLAVTVLISYIELWFFSA